MSFFRTFSILLVICTIALAKHSASRKLKTTFDNSSEVIRTHELNMLVPSTESRTFDDDKSNEVSTSDVSTSEAETGPKSELKKAFGRCKYLGIDVPYTQCKSSCSEGDQLSNMKCDNNNLKCCLSDHRL